MRRIAGDSGLSHRRKRTARALGWILVTASFLLTAVWERVEVATLLIRIDGVRAAKGRLASEVDYLAMQRGRKLSYREVEPLVAEHLGLGTATVEQIVRLKPEELRASRKESLPRAEGTPATTVFPSVRRVP